MPRLCWDCLVFPVQASKALKISVYVCVRVHAFMNHTHMCIHLCVSVQSSCKHMWRPEIDIAMPSSITSPPYLSTILSFISIVTYYHSVCMVHVCECGHTSVMWRSKDNFQESALLPSWVPGIKLGLSGICGRLSYAQSHPAGPPPNFLRQNLSLNFAIFG